MRLLNLFIVIPLIGIFYLTSQAAEFSCVSLIESESAVQRCLSNYADELLQDRQAGFDTQLSRQLRQQSEWGGQPVAAQRNTKPLSAFSVEFDSSPNCGIFNQEQVSVDRNKGKKKRVLEAKKQVEEIIEFLFEYHLMNNGLKASSLFQIQKVHLCSEDFQERANEKPRSFAFTRNILQIKIPVKRRLLDWGYQPVKSSEILSQWNAGHHFKPNRILQRREIVNYSMYRLWPLLNPTGRIRLFVRKFLAEKVQQTQERTLCSTRSCEKLLSKAKELLSRADFQRLSRLSLERQKQVQQKAFEKQYVDMDLRIELLAFAALKNSSLNLDIERETRFAIVNVQNAHVINVSFLLSTLGQTDKDYVEALERFSPDGPTDNIRIRHSNGVSLVNVDTFDYVNVNVNLLLGLSDANFYVSLKDAL